MRRWKSFTWQWKLFTHGQLLCAMVNSLYGRSAYWRYRRRSTLLGSFSTYLFQSRTAERAEAFARDERLRQEQLIACSAYAASSGDAQLIKLAGSAAC
jgi:hypothetical protein